MAEETSSLAEVALTPESEHEWELLRELVDFADRLVVAFIFADRFAVRVLRARMEREARERDMPFRLLTCDTPTELRENALAAILSPASEHEVTWLEAFGSEADLRGAWFFAAQRWNEHREPLRRSTLRALIVAAPIWAKPVIRLAAPDLWSITNLVIEPRALPAGRLEATPAERLLAERAVEEALALEAGERRTWALIQAVPDAVRAGAVEAALRAAESLDLSLALDRIAGFYSSAGVGRGALAAKSLNDLGDSLLALEHHEASLLGTHAAAAASRKSAPDGPAAFLSDLKRSLDDLGTRLSELGLHKDALVAAVESVAHEAELAAARSEPASDEDRRLQARSSIGSGTSG